MSSGSDNKDFRIQPWLRVPAAIRSYVEELVVDGGPEKITELVNSGVIGLGSRDSSEPVDEKSFIIHTSPSFHAFYVYWNTGDYTFTASAYTVDLI